MFQGATLSCQSLLPLMFDCLGLVWLLWWVYGVRSTRSPQGPFTARLRTLLPRTIPDMLFGTRVLTWAVYIYVYRFFGIHSCGVCSRALCRKSCFYSYERPAHPEKCRQSPGSRAPPIPVMSRAAGVKTGLLLRSLVQMTPCYGYIVDSMFSVLC